MLSYYQYSIILETFHFDSNNMFPFGFLLKNGANLASSSSIRQQLFSKTTSGGRWQRDINISYFQTLTNMLTCRSVWGFECFVSILCFKIFIHFHYNKPIKKWIIIIFCIFDVLLSQLYSSWGSRSWCCTKSRSCTRCCMYQTNDGAVPHMMFLDQIMVLDLINMWNFTLDTITFLTAF